MKKLLSITLAVLALNTMSAQKQENKEHNHAKAHHVTVDAKDKTIDAETISYNVPEEMLEEVFENRMRSMGAPRKTIKWKVVKGAQYYPAVKMGEVSGDKMDYYFILDGNKKESSLTIFASHGYDNFITREEEPEVFNSLARFLVSLNQDLDTEEWKEQVAEQEEVTAKANKELERDQSDLENLEKQLEKIQQDIESKKAEIEEDKQMLSQEQEKLENLRNKKN